MWRYVLKRLLWFIPTLLIVTLIGFFLLSSAPGNPVNTLISSNSSHGSIAGYGNVEAQKKFWTKKLGLDLPMFYFTLTTLATPDTIYKIQNNDKRAHYKYLLSHFGNAKEITNYLINLKQLQLLFNEELHKINDDSNHVFLIAEKEQLHTIESAINLLESETDDDKIKSHLNIINSNSSALSINLKKIAYNLNSTYNQLEKNKSNWKNYIPKIAWYGIDNQYHKWLFGSNYSSGLIRGDFGISYIKKEPVIYILKDKVIWSVFFSLLSIMLAYLISIPLGLTMAQNPNSQFSKTTQTILFLLYSTPPFFLGVLLLMIFSNPDLLAFFPASGIKPAEGYSENASIFLKFYESLPHIVLPLICYTYSSLAFITKLTATSVTEQLPSDYIKTAFAKGLSDKQVIKKHAFKNSLIPLITVFGSVFPSIIGGSVIIESIFTIPGMGLESIKAIISRDYPVIIAVITLTTLLTMISYLISDLLCFIVDPRIRNRNN